jgi:V/A-type H+-transporting ATPase subunit F
MLKIAVIGGPETVMGFKAVGLDVFPAIDDREALNILNKLTENPDNYAIIYIEETLAVNMQKEIAKYSESPIPAIILIPGREGSIGLGQSALKAAVERAIGTNILDN